MKKSLLIAILLLPLAYAKASSETQIIPVPECFPCNPETLTVGTAIQIIPVPECFPCNPETLTVAAAIQIIPVPECFPCNPEALTIAGSIQIIPVPDCFPCNPDTRRSDVKTKKTVASVRATRNP